MAFLPEYQKQNTATPKDTTRAKRLHAALLAKGHARTGWSESKWANQFRLLRKDIGSGAANRIRKVMNWFEENMDKKYCPLVRSADSFRHKFTQIESVMKRDERDNPTVELTPEALDLSRQIQNENSWPLKSRAMVPVVVQISLNNIRSFLRKVAKYRNKLRKQKFDCERLTREAFVEKVLAQFAGGVNAFVTSWMENANRRILGWEGWSGKLLPWAFSEDHNSFDMMMGTLSQEYCGSLIHWIELKEAVSGKSN